MTERMRPLDVRVGEYRDSLLSLADQLEALGVSTNALAAVADGVKLYRLVAGDLTVLLDGDELRPFLVTGVIPD